MRIRINLPRLCLAIAGCSSFFFRESGAVVTDLFVQKVEVTQGVQCFDQSKGYPNCPDNSLKLENAKPTAIRVYLGHDDRSCDASNPKATVAKNVQVSISWAVWKAGQDPPNLLLTGPYSIWIDVPCSNDIGFLRQDSSLTANFFISPYELSSVPFSYPERVLYLWAEVVSPPSMTDVNPNNNRFFLQLGNSASESHPGGLKMQEALVVKWVFVYYDPVPAPFEMFSYNGPTRATCGPYPVTTCRPGDSTLMKTLYPMPIDYRLVGTPLMYSCDVYEDCPTIATDAVDFRNVLLQRLATMKGTMKPEPDVLVGWLPGAAAGSTKGLGTNAGNVAWCTDREEIPFCLAHEVGHCMGVDHLDEVPERTHAVWSKIARFHEKGKSSFETSSSRRFSIIAVPQFRGTAVQQNGNKLFCAVGNAAPPSGTVSSRGGHTKLEG